MFTLAEIKAAHALVKSGADFPKYIQDLLKLGVISYETYVKDRNSKYYGRDYYFIESTEQQEYIEIAEQCNEDGFFKALQLHQDGETDFPTFCKECGEFGIDRWVSDLQEMTCTYYDKAGNKVYVEAIPS